MHVQYAACMPCRQSVLDGEKVVFTWRLFTELEFSGLHDIIRWCVACMVYAPHRTNSKWAILLSFDCRVSDKFVKERLVVVGGGQQLSTRKPKNNTHIARVSQWTAVNMWYMHILCMQYCTLFW